MHCSRGAIQSLESNSLSYESWLIHVLSLETYLLKFHCKSKVKEFLLETWPLDKYLDIYFLVAISLVARGFGGEVDRIPSRSCWISCFRLKSKCPTASPVFLYKKNNTAASASPAKYISRQTQVSVKIVGGTWMSSRPPNVGVQDSGATNVIFRKISVRKTIWDLELSEHLL